MTLAVLLMVVAAINLMVGVMVFGRKYQHPLHQSFLLMTIGVGMWSFAIGLYLITPNVDRALLYVNIYYLSALLIASSMFAFVNSLKASNGSAVTLPVVLALCVPFVYAVAAILNPNVLLTIDQHPFQITIHMTAYAIYTVVFSLLFVGATISLVRQVLSAKGRRRSQLLVVCVGVVIAGIVGMVCNLILPIFNVYTLIWVGPLFSVFFLLSMSYAVVRYRLFDLRLALARALAYLISLFVVVIIYASALYFVGITLFGLTETTSLQSLVYLGMAVLLAFTFQPMKHFFDKLSSQLFFKQPVDPEVAIEKFGDIILAEVELEPLARNVFGLMDETFKPSFITLWVDNPFTSRHEIISTSRSPGTDTALGLLVDELAAYPDVSTLDVDELDQQQDHKLLAKLEKFKIGLVLPIRTTKRQIGYAFIGHRLSGGGYSSVDRSILTTVADELALAIENSLQFQQITDFNKTLQENVERATRELRQSNRKLHDLDESKDEFISMASHQLRTPLTTVKGYLSMMLDGDVGEISPQQRKVLEEAFNSSQRMVYLISDFLNVSRLQSGKFELELHDIDIAEVLAQEVRQMEDGARSRKMKLEYRRPDNIPNMSLDENKIRQVIMNFLDNAIYYSKPGGTIKVSLTKHAGYLALKVVDQGIGVPAGERHKLFSKFYRASNAKKQRPDGTGIGLFMARKVIVAHGGSMIFEAAHDKGSTFGFRLPLSQ